MPQFLQGFERLRTDLGIDPELAHDRRRLAERADEVVGHEPRGDDRRGRLEAEVDVIEQELQGHLVLVIAAGDADGQHGPTVFQDDRGRQSDPWPLAGNDHVGVSLPDVEALQPAAEPDAGVTGHDPRPAARRCRHHISPSCRRPGRWSCRVHRPPAAASRRAAGSAAGSSTALPERGSPGRRSSEACLGSINDRRFDGIFRQEQGLQRHVDEERIRVISIAVGHGEL